MMAGERHGVASWPGVISVASCSYTLSHGITPGTAILRILPQARYPDEVGDLVIGDGVDAVTIPDCKIDDMKVQNDGTGFIWSLEIVDRRWKWRDLGSISGCYNQLDPHGKLIPWTIRSPSELAKLCLDAMGETTYSIDLPAGLTRRDGQNFGKINPPWIGVIPTTGTNPPINWVQETPAMALQSLCELFGRRVIYKWSTNNILIAVRGIGGQLPNGSIAKDSPSIKSSEKPSGVGIAGAPTKYQCRLLLEAVGEEWDGSYRAIDQLSYAPLATAGLVQVNTATCTATGSNKFGVWINAPAGQGPFFGVEFDATSATPSTVVSTIAAAINASADPRVRGVVTAASAGPILTVTGVKVGQSYTFTSSIFAPVTGTGAFPPELAQAAISARADWRYCVPPIFDGVRRTDRLILVDAIRLAQRSVYRTYRLADISAVGRGPISIPGYGKLKRRQQIVLQNTQVEQIVPVPGDDRLVNALFQPITINFYDGYSRDKPAACFGSVAIQGGAGGAFAFWLPNQDQQNTASSDQIFTAFSIDPEKQIVAFSSPIFRTQAGQFLPAKPVLQTGVNIRDADTNAFVVYKTAQPLANQSGDTNFAWRTAMDVQQNIIADYAANSNNVSGVRVFEADAAIRAKYYRTGLAAQYIDAAGDTEEYNGLVSVDVDGAICQITWNVGENGASTIASVNTEHAIWQPPYPARRRAEFLRPAQQAKLGSSQANPYTVFDNPMPQTPNLNNPWLFGSGE